MDVTRRHADINILFKNVRKTNLLKRGYQK